MSRQTRSASSPSSGAARFTFQHCTQNLHTARENDQQCDHASIPVTTQQATAGTQPARCTRTVDIFSVIDYRADRYGNDAIEEAITQRVDRN